MKQAKKRFSYRLWHSLADIRIGVVLMILLSLNLCLGFFCLNRQSALFEPMNNLGILPWLNTYGLSNLRHTAWLFILLLLLLLLAINTLLCTGHRLLHLVGRWRQQGGNRTLYFRLSTHVMHIGMVAILSGYLLSYTMTQVFPSQTLVPGREIAIAGTPLQLEVVSMKLPVYQGKRLELFAGRVIKPEIDLRLVADGEERTAVLGFNDPVRFQGYTVFLQHFSPRSKSSMTTARYIVVDIRRDPGASLYFTGAAIFIPGMFGYIMFRTGSRTSRNIS